MKYRLLSISAVFSLFFTSCQMSQHEENTTLFIGTYTDKGSEGIYKYSFNTEDGQLMQKSLVAKMVNPSFLKISPDKKNLYAVSEVADFEGDSGSITSFQIEGDSLIKLNTKSTMGEHPCHVSVSGNGNLVAASNYTGGSVAIYGTEENGSLSSDFQFIDHKKLDTTKTSHAHASLFRGNNLFVADLGLDAVRRYQLQDEKVLFTHEPSLDMVAGAGPRHFEFGQDGKFLYVINELNSTITVFKRDKEGFIEVETKSTLASDFVGESFCADIHLSNDGKFLYGSNRGENTIVIFKVDSETGELALIGREGVHGDWPRNFSIDPSGKFLLVANQKSNNISVFKRDREQGTLDYIHEIELSSPVCLEFLE
jgi:6-phosphogluconolactonase